jgi:SAM-dependent methyltransferase
MDLTLTPWVPAVADAGLARNGYARLRDLSNASYIEVMQSLERFQVEFLARTRSVWRKDFAFTGDSLYNFSRQWEYPYAWQNLGAPSGRVLDAGSGITFFPFLLAAAGWKVECCDVDASLGAPVRTAVESTGHAVEFSATPIENMRYEDGTFDAVACISVLEHLGPVRPAAIRELGRVLKPKGRLVLTCDLSLGRDGDIILEDLAELLGQLQGTFAFCYPLDLHRTTDLLTTDHFRHEQEWRLPWRTSSWTSGDLVRLRWLRKSFRSIAVLGLTAEKK